MSSSPPKTNIPKETKFKTLGKKDAPILVITEPVELGEKTVMPKNYAAFFKKVVEGYGLEMRDFSFLSPCPAIPKEIKKIKSKSEKYVASFREPFAKALQSFTPKIIMTLGKDSAGAISGKNVTLSSVDARITKHKTTDKPVVCSYGIGYCLVQKKTYPLETSLEVVKSFIEGKDQTDQANFSAEWREDISDIIEYLESEVEKGKTPLVAYDTETTGLEWYNDTVKPLTLQLAYAPDKAVISCVHPRYRRTKDIPKIVEQWKRILENPKILKAGHNFKFDHHISKKLGINVKGWRYDTQMLAWFADEEMPQKNLAACTKRWVKSMAGYSDIFDEHADKAFMMGVAYDDMLDYGCGDVIATYLLTEKLLEILKKDPKHLNVYYKVKLPALLALAEMEETGLPVNIDKLNKFVPYVDKIVLDQHNKLVDMIPKPVMRYFVKTENIKDFKDPEQFKFTPDQLTKILFSKNGLGLKPKQLTETTRKPKTDSKHLSLFEDNEFVALYMDYKRNKDLKSKYVGQPATETQEAKGFYKHITKKNRIHTSFHLLTTTGRSGSRSPNLQNLSKKTDLAWEFRKVFEAEEGWSFVSADLSQIELRLIAWESGDPRMTQAYINDEDLHAVTAATAVQMSYEEFLKLPLKKRKGHRKNAKPVNFGYCYELHYKSYPEYARTQYGVHVTEQEAKDQQDNYFKLYKKVKPWHEWKKDFAKKHGFVRSLHGLKRTLPQIHSSNYGESSAAGRDAINNGIQGFASDLGLLALISTIKFLSHLDVEVASPVLFIHDDDTFLVKDEYVEDFCGVLLWFMANPPIKKLFGLDSPVPFKGGIAIGKNLGEMEEDEEEKYKPIHPKESIFYKNHLKTKS